MSLKVLVAGFSTRHVCQSAHRAGHQVYAVDHFCDRDLDWYTDACQRFEELDEVSDCIDTMARLHRCDLLVATSGAESMDTPLPRAGTRSDIAAQFMDKCRTQEFFEELDIPVPPRAAPGDYPAMIKPLQGAGGWRNAVVSTGEERRAWEEAWEGIPYVLQQYRPGRPVSVSCIAGGGRAQAIAVNEQFLREDEDAAFGFSGSVTPALSHPFTSRLIDRAERAAAASGCIGSVGVDFVCDGDEAWAIEINPRFQATVDTVELATGVNLFDLHLDACRGRIPGSMPPARFVGIRRIIFSDRDLVVRSDLAPLAPGVADIPRVGTEIEAGHAVVSVLARGLSREDAFRALENTMTRVNRCMDEW